MKYYFIILFLIFSLYTTAQNYITICSWNLENFGKSKGDAEIEFIANTVKDFDVIIIIEVVAGEGGAQAVARLNEVLNRKGFKWDYTISDPTTSSAYKTERYAFIWKPNILTIVGKAWLENKYNLEIDREPFFATFKSRGKLFTLAGFHAITKKMQPETEIKFFKFLPSEYPDKNILFCGDFNCPQSHTVFNPLKSMGYKPIFEGQKTSLRQECINGDCLASEFDNVFYNSTKVNFISSGIIKFYEKFETLKDARTVSDHVPIFFRFSFD